MLQPFPTKRIDTGDLTVPAFLNRRGAEVHNVLILFGFGVWTLFFNSFNTCPRVYYVMEALMPPNAWGVLFIIVGLVKLVVVRRNSLTVRKWFALYCGGLWTMVAISVFCSEPTAPVCPIYTVFAINMYRVFLFIKLGHHRRHDDC